LQAVQDLAATEGKRFAVIADEAHSSQTGEAAAKLKQLLSAQEWAELQDGGEVDTEALLAAQMAAVHIATMTSARRLRSADTIPKQDSAERAFNKLARTFATQMEALTRYRTGGEQKVVQHVSVSEGGQAIVGNVTQAPRQSAANSAASGT